MSAPVRQRGFLLNLAAEGMAPAVPGCVNSLPRETAIDRFGLHIVSRWLDWLNEQPLAVRRSAIGELADLPANRARIEAVAAIDSFAANASIDDRASAVEYLCALPRYAQSEHISRSRRGDDHPAHPHGAHFSKDFRYRRFYPAQRHRKRD